MLKGGVGQKERCGEGTRCDWEQPLPKSVAGWGAWPALLDAESELVTIAWLLWDCDVIPGTQTREEANKGESRSGGRWSWGGGNRGGV